MMHTTSIALGEPDWILVESDEGRISARYSECIRALGDVSVSMRSRQDGEHVILSSRCGAVRTVRLRWKRDMPIEARYLCDEWERSYGTLGFEGLRANRIMPWYFLCAQEGITTGYGVMVRPNAMCFWQVDAAGLTLVLDVRNGGEGVFLGGRQLDLATIKVRAYEAESFPSACAFCTELCNDPLLPEAPVYGSNNWYYAYGDSSAEQVMRDAEYLAELTVGNAIRPYMVIDDGWQMSRERLDSDNGGPWRGSNTRFPDMAGLARGITDRNVIPGIWVRPLLDDSPDIPAQWRLPNGCLDPTNPEALNHVKEDMRALCQWGYRLIKHDFTTFDLFDRWGFQMNPLVTAEGWHFRDRTVTNAQIVKTLYQAILESAQEYGALVLGCDTMGHLGAGLMHISRTGDDTSGMDWERTRRNGVNTLAFRLPQHNAFFELDADCIGISSDIDWSYNRQWADIVARSGTSLFFSVAPHSMPPADERDLVEVLKIASSRPSRMRPADWEYTDCPESWSDGLQSSTYHWYDEHGINYANAPKRYLGYLAFDE